MVQIIHSFNLFVGLKTFKNEANEDDYIVELPEVIMDAYFKTIPYLLVLMALLFYLPKSFWNYFENDRLDVLTKSVSGPIFVLDQSTDHCRVGTLQGHMIY
jgi:hypothetical protein